MAGRSFFFFLRSILTLVLMQMMNGNEMGIMKSGAGVEGAGLLYPNFYAGSCPALIPTVRQAVQDAADFDPVNLPALLRLHFHDCFVNGADGSILLDPINGVPSEKNSSLNLGLFGFEAIDFIKDVVDMECGVGVVSCADILALAARDAVVLSGGPTWDVPLGRKDGRRSLASDVPGKIPTPELSVGELLNGFFYPNGLNETDLTALTGAHTIGFAHCASFDERLYNPQATDPPIDDDFLQQVEAVCPEPPQFVDPDTVVPLEPFNFTNFDINFYLAVQRKMSVLITDRILLYDPRTKGDVAKYANTRKSGGIPQGQRDFFKQFAISMVKMSQIGLPNILQGEVRNNCRVPN